MGGLIATGTTIWYWSYTSRHVASRRWISPDEAFSQEDRLNMMEAVYRHMWRTPPSAASAAVSFFGVGESNDPPAELLQRLSDLPVPVKPASLAVQKNSSIVDAETGKQGVAFYIENAQMNNPDEAQVAVLIRPGRGSAGSKYLYTVRRDNGKWKVTRDKPN